MEAQRNPHELIPTNEGAQLAVMAVEVRHVLAGIERIEAAQKAAVPRTEWEQRNAYVDQRFATQTEKFAEVNQKFASAAADMASRRVPWTAIGAFFVGAAALLLTLIERLTA